MRLYLIDPLETDPLCVIRAVDHSTEGPAGLAALISNPEQDIHVSHVDVRVLEIGGTLVDAWFNDEALSVPGGGAVFIKDAEEPLFGRVLLAGVNENGDTSACPVNEGMIRDGVLTFCNREDPFFLHFKDGKMVRYGDDHAIFREFTGTSEFLLTCQALVDGKFPYEEQEVAPDVS